MAEAPSTLFSSIHIEDGNQIIDIEEDIEKYELLSLLFHREAIPIDQSEFVVTAKNDRKRYFGDSTVCYKCGEIGHVSRDCTKDQLRNCVYCSTRHRGRPCDYLFCDRCSRFGHAYHFCREPRPDDRLCNACPDQVHYITECPRVWRHYRFRSKETRSVAVMSCPLCFSTSHFLDDCEQKARKFSIFTKRYLRIARPSQAKKAKKG